MIFLFFFFFSRCCFFFFFQFFSNRKILEQRTYQNDERIGTLEQQLAEAQLIAEDSDRKYDEVISRDRLSRTYCSRTKLSRVI